MNNFSTSVDKNLAYITRKQIWIQDDLAMCYIKDHNRFSLSLSFV